MVPGYISAWKTIVLLSGYDKNMHFVFTFPEKVQFYASAHIRSLHAEM
jgi:hypothetical protein